MPHPGEDLDGRAAVRVGDLLARLRRADLVVGASDQQQRQPGGDRAGFGGGGERRQFAPLKDLIFDIPELISTISRGTTLLPGDLIATGTPAGVGLGFDPPRFLASGDVVEVTVTGLGTLRNRIA